MKKITSTFKAVILLLILLTSCNNEETVQSNEIIDLTVYQKLEEKINEGLNRISINLRSNKATFSNKELTLQSAEKYFSNNSEGLLGFEKTFKNNSNYRITENNQMTPFQKRKVNKIIESANDFENINEFISHLSVEFDNYANSSLNIDDKRLLLTFITVYKTSLIFFEKNQDVIKANISSDRLRVQGFWKCAAGIIGGATGGAIAGGELGLKIGTLVANPLKGAIIGGIIGGIGGAFGGGAAAC